MTPIIPDSYCVKFYTCALWYCQQADNKFLKGINKAVLHCFTRIVLGGGVWVISLGTYEVFSNKFSCTYIRTKSCYHAPVFHHCQLIQSPHIERQWTEARGPFSRPGDSLCLNWADRAVSCVLFWAKLFNITPDTATHLSQWASKRTPGQLVWMIQFGQSSALPYIPSDLLINVDSYVRACRDEAKE